MRIKVDLPTEKSKSRKVNKYVKMQLEIMALNNKLNELGDQATLLHGSLNGAQAAEAKRILWGPK